MNTKKTSENIFKYFYFKFEFASTNQVLKYINEIDCNKSSAGETPSKIIKLAEKKLTVPITSYKYVHLIEHFSG